MFRLILLGLALVGCESVDSKLVAPPPRPAAPAIEPPPPAALPATADLSGPWEGRGLLPFHKPALWTLETTTRTAVRPGVWRFESELVMHTRDHVRTVGTAKLVGTTEFRGSTACSTLASVSMELQPWTEEIPIAAQTRAAVAKGGQHRSGCVDVVSVTAEHIELKRGDLAWKESRPRGWVSP